MMASSDSVSAWKFGLALGCLVALTGPGRSADEAAPAVLPSSSRDPLVETGSESDHLTGDWGGIRSRWVERGVHFQFGYVAESMANVSGGVRRGGAYNGLAEMALALDLEKLIGAWRGGELYVSSLWLHGDSPTVKRVGDVLAVSNIDAYDSLRLYELWLQQSFLADKVSIRLGNLLADSEFAFTDYGGLFLNSAFGWPAFVSANTVNTGPAFFVATPGVRLRLDPCEHIYFQAGIYDGDSFDDPVGADVRKNASGTRFHLGREQGMFTMFEAGLKLNQHEAATGLPGTYKIGGWVHSGSVATAGQGVHGLYIAAEQLIWREAAGSDQGLGLFVRAGGSPSHSSTFNFVMDGGIHYQGLLPGRDADLAGLGVVYARVSDSVRAASLAGAITPLPDHETVIEATYLVQLKPWWTIQPNLQWVLHPGGSGAVSDAVVVGLRTSFTF